MAQNNKYYIVTYKTDFFIIFRDTMYYNFSHFFDQQYLSFIQISLIIQQILLTNKQIFVVSFFFLILRNSIIYRYIEEMEYNKVQKNNSDVFRSSFTFSESKHNSNNTTCAQSFLFQQATPSQSPREGPEVTTKIINQNRDTSNLREAKPHYRRSEYIQRKSEINQNDNLFVKYQAIQKILYSQNLNLKQQNMLLLTQINRLRESNKKYRHLDQTKKLELQKTREQALAYKNKAEQLQEILNIKLACLERLVLTKQPTEGNKSLEELLNYSDQFSK